MATFRVTITGEYEVEPSDLVHYFTEDPFVANQGTDMKAAAEIDQGEFNDDLYLALEAIGQDWDVKVEVVE